ncbi:MAG: hypothetical protein KJ995_01200 [Candidatus Omnitrophica bacterium]|nr:hypothetical protein [Candidatus Omnitrophota bacterium]MBU1851007.1 hypothetical protein [Candidatus Omnitrophota bacterium]
MEMNLDSVIEKLQTEGVNRAEERASAIIKEAETKAANIVSSAKRQKDVMLEKAEKEAEEFRINVEVAIKQAARDVIIAIRAQMEALLDSIIKKEVSAQLTPDVLKDIITKLVTTSIEREEVDLEILLGENDKRALRETLGALLQGELKKGVVIKASPALKKGFRIGKKGENEYYDFSDDAISEAFNFYLNKKLRKIIDIGLKDAQ